MITDDALPALYDKVYRFFLSRRIDKDYACDLTQEVFFRVIKTNKDIDNLEAYCIGHAKKIIYEAYRTQTRANNLVNVDGLSIPDPSDSERCLLNKEKLLRVSKAIRSFSKKNQQIFRDRFIHNIQSKDLKAKYNLDGDAIDMRVHRLRKYLRSVV